MPPTGLGLRLLGMVRVSTGKQAQEDKEGIPRQQEAIKRIVAAHEATLVGGEPLVVQVTGVAVATAPEWEQVLSLVGGGVHLVVDSIDRIGRVEGFDVDSVQSFDDLRRKNVKVYTPSKVWDLSDPAESMMANVLALFAGYERAQIRRRTSNARTTKLARGEWASGPQPHGLRWLKKEKKWEETPDINHIKETFAWYTEQGLTYAAIGRKLSTHPTLVRYWLRCPVYIGRLPGDDNVPLVGMPVPPIDMATWEQAQARMEVEAARIRKTRESNGPGIYLSAHLWSAYEEPVSPPGPQTFALGSEPWGQRKHVVYGHRTIEWDRHTRYSCRCRIGGTNAPSPVCKLGRLRAERVNRAVDNYLEKLVGAKWFRAAALRLTTKANGRDAREMERVRLTRELADIDKQLGRLLDLYVAGGFERAELDKKKVKLDGEKARITATLKNLDAEPQAPGRAAVQAALAEFTYSAMWEPSKKREWLTRHDVRIYITNDGITDSSLTLHTTEGMMTCDGLRPMTWDELLGHPLVSRTQGPGTYTLAGAARVLGVNRDTLSKWVNRGVVPTPTGMQGKQRRWTTEDIEATQKALAERPVTALGRSAGEGKARPGRRKAKT